jgi:plasmid stabilization system protein ParE
VTPISEPLTLRLTEKAEADLAEIWFYVAGEASEATATRQVAPRNTGPESR